MHGLSFKALIDNNDDRERIRPRIVRQSGIDRGDGGQFMGEESGAQAQADAGEKPPSRVKEGLIVLGALVLGGVLLFGIYIYWNFERDHPATENAYLQANYMWISPQVDGQISEIYVVENQLVEEGDLLFAIDPRSFDAELKAAQANLVLVHQDIEAGKARVTAAKAVVTAQMAAVEAAKQKSDRTKPLVGEDVVTELKGIELEQALAEEQAKLKQVQANVVVAEREYGTPETIKAQIEKAESALAIAQLNRDWTVIRAPAKGYVTSFALRKGDVVQSADALFPFVEINQWWIQANFKETSIDRIKSGQPVTVKIDMYGGREFTGAVESLGSSSAASFSLLPAQNTTGNWVKVTQRVPVRITLQDFNEEYPYRFGASASVEVNTDARVGGADSSQ
jgi:membrane fusion protein (multidrug efflux system)